MQIMTSVNTSFMAFILTVFCYLLINTTNLEDKKDLVKWWFYVKWVVFLTFLLLTISVICLFNSLQSFIQWNVPNQYVIQHGCSNYHFFTNRKEGDIWSWSISLYTGWCLGTGIPTLLILSLAVYMKNRL